MTPWRSALLGGLAYSLAFAIWLIAGLEPGPLPLSLGSVHRILLWSQALGVALLLPAVAKDDGSRAALLAPVLAVAIPWPILTLFSLAGNIPTETLIVGQLVLVTWALALGGLWRLLSRWINGPSIAYAVLQAIAILAPLFGFEYTASLVRL